MAEAFRAFYERWLPKQEILLQHLLLLSSSSPSDELIRSSIGQVLCHYKEYPFLMLSPPWLSSYERALLWLGGFKPSMVFQLAKRALRETLSDSQLAEIERMLGDTRREEKKIEEVMAGVQESMANLPTYLIRRFGGLVDGEVSELDEAMRVFKERVIEVLETADAFRGTTVTKLLQNLSPPQIVQFLAAAAQYTIRTRRWRSIELHMHNIHIYLLLLLLLLNFFLFFSCSFNLGRISKREYMVLP